jgi:hypothetical protein
MISIRLEMDLFNAALKQRLSINNPDIAVRFQAELELEQVKAKRLKMRGENRLNPELQTKEGDARR